MMGCFSELLSCLKTKMMNPAAEFSCEPVKSYLLALGLWAVPSGLGPQGRVLLTQPHSASGFVPDLFGCQAAAIEEVNLEDRIVFLRRIQLMRTEVKKKVIK